MAPPSGGTRTSLVGRVAALLRGPAKQSQAQDGPAPANWGTPGQTYELKQFQTVFQPPGLFAPSYPLAPTEPERVRTWDFPVGINTVITPRAYEPISFAQLRALADSYDIARLAIETRKDQIEALEWGIKPRDEENPAPDAEERADRLTEFWRKPDGERPFGSWLRFALEDVLVLDAASFEVRRTRGGEIIGIDIIDGSTIKVLVDQTGRRPLPPAPAYQQVIKGRPWRLLTTDELIYLPRNPRPHKAYGYGPIEQIILTVNIGLRRQHMQLQHFTEGNVPPGMINAPDGWNPEQINQFQEWFDSFLAGNTGSRTRLFWGPAGSKYQEFKEPPYKDEFDEWLARIVCYAFSLPPTAFTRQINRATAQTAQEAALEEGLAPLMRWVKQLVDQIIQDRMGHDDLEFSWSDVRATDPKDQAIILSTYVKDGIYALNEARDILGLDPVEGGDEPLFLTATGPVLMSTVLNPPEPTQSSPDGAAGEARPGERRRVKSLPATLAKRRGRPPARPALPFAKRARLRAAPGRNVRLMQRAERRLTRKLAAFFRKRAAHVAAQIAQALGLDRSDKAAGPAATLVAGRNQDHHRVVGGADDPDAVAKAPDDMAAARAVAILHSIDLGEDWSVELLDLTADELAAVYADGVERALPLVGFTTGDETVNDARGALGLPPIDGGDTVPAIVSQVDERAVEWARERAADLIAQIEDNTRDMLRATVTRAIEEGWSAATLADEIEQSAGFSEARAEAVSRTELIRSNNQGLLAAYKETGVATGKEWLTAQDDLVEEDCQDNEDAGPIGLDDVFPSGDDAPPAHVNCRCVLAATTEPLEGADEE